MITQKHGTWNIRLSFALPIKFMQNSQSTLNDSDCNLVSFDGFAYLYIRMKRQTNGNLMTAYNVGKIILTLSTLSALLTNSTHRWRLSLWQNGFGVQQLINWNEFYIYQNPDDFLHQIGEVFPIDHSIRLRFASNSISLKKISVSMGRNANENYNIRLCFS